MVQKNLIIPLKIKFSVKNYPIHPRGWEVMSALAIAIKDFKVAQNSLESLQKIEGSSHSIELCLLQSQYHLSQVNYVVLLILSRK